MKEKGAFLSFAILHNNIYKQYNTLYTSTITAARSKLKNFELNISLCAQLAVLSDKNANIVQERSLGLYKYNEKKQHDKCHAAYYCNLAYSFASNSLLILWTFLQGNFQNCSIIFD